ncbi:hypothetical protein F511_27567 [Dorcoceras hygrometricum]|uniref:Uncharacterized protein n=1 Tax=Dorcoceras hygrometricum TaxID=472368 RepID=A0A2Z7B0N9_9LAMI|nr:hypothetical protein F511_27567 [Dorcoceras hygrometricum]
MKATARAGRALVAQETADACAPFAHRGRHVARLVAPQAGRPRANRCAIGKRRCALDGRRRAAGGEDARKIVARCWRWKRATVRRLGRALVAASREVLRTLAPFLPAAARHGRRMLALSCDDGRPKRAAGCAPAAASFFPCGGGAAGGRRCGDVVTAGLNSFRA